MSADPAPEPRRAGPGDALALADLWWRARLAAAPAIPLPVHDADEVRRWFAAVVVPEMDVWVIDESDRLAALLVLHAGWIEQSYVDPERTGEGLGSTLVDLAKRAHPAGLDLWAFQANTGARRFYERHGFTAVAETDGDNEEGAPDVRYHWPRERDPLPGAGGSAAPAGVTGPP